MTRFFRRQLYVRRLKRGCLKPFKVVYHASNPETGDSIRVTTIEYAGSWKAVQRWHRKEPPIRPGYPKISRIRQR